MVGFVVGCISWGCVLIWSGLLEGGVFVTQGVGWLGWGWGLGFFSDSVKVHGRLRIGKNGIVFSGRHEMRLATCLVNCGHLL